MVCERFGVVCYCLREVENVIEVCGGLRGFWDGLRYV